MSRHRMEAHRTLWPAAGQSARRVLFHAAIRRATPGHAKPAVAPAWAQRLVRSQRGVLNRAGRRLLVSPWFAAGAGVVIATGVVIYSPHASLNFGRAITVSPCGADCMPMGGAPPVPAGSGVGQVTTPPGTRSAGSATTFWYEVLSQNEFGFSMQITIRSRQSISHWQLSFVIPGARDLYVPGARTSPYGADGVTVSNVIAGTESVGYTSISGHQFGGTSQQGDIVQFTVFGRGTPGAPARCQYNKATCQFVPSPR